MRAVLLVLVMLTGSAAAATPVTVFLERGGHREQTDDGDVVQIPRFGGTTRVWNAVVGCVRDKFSAFAVDVVDQRPQDGDFITAVVGGSADQLGYDPDKVAGVGPEDGHVIPDAIVHVFSRTIGERDTQQLCETTAHEIGHALGLDHSMQCGDLMSYPRDECGERPTLTFTDVDAACGEYSERQCEWGDTQNSYQRLAALVGLHGEATTPEDDSTDSPTSTNSPSSTDTPGWFNANPDPWAMPEPTQSSPTPESTQSAPDSQPNPPMTESCGGHRHRHHSHRRQRANRTRFRCRSRATGIC